MSSSEKGDDNLLKDEWVVKLEESAYMQKLSMNNLIMNYLVTGGGNFSFFLFHGFIFVSDLSG